MSEAKFTKGPWVIESDYTDGKDEYYGHWCKVGPVELCMKDPDANAHLIAAAPELYEALEDAVDLLTAAGYSTLEHRSALAKARGEV